MAPKKDVSNGRKGLWDKFKYWSNSNRNGGVEQEDKPSRYEEFYTKHQEMIRIFCYLVLFGAFLAFLIAGLVINFQQTLPLLIITAVVIGYLIYAYIRDTYGNTIYKVAIEPVLRFIDAKWWILKWFAHDSSTVTLQTVSYLLMYIYLLVYFF